MPDQATSFNAPRGLACACLFGTKDVGRYVVLVCLKGSRSSRSTKSWTLPPKELNSSCQLQVKCRLLDLRPVMRCAN